VIAALAPFRLRPFRFQWTADLCTAWALEMETLILGWYVLVETGSVTLLTVFGSLQFIGTLVSPMLGALGDRLGLRNVLAAMRLSYALFAAVILGFALAGRLDATVVIAVAALCGLVRPTDIGMRSALVGATVPPTLLVSAMGISRTTMDSAKVGGALAGAGFMAAFGMVPAYITILAIYGVGVVLTLCVDGGRAPRHAAPQAGSAAAGRAAAGNDVAAPPRPTPLRDLREGLVYVWKTPRLLAAMTLAALVNLTAFPLTGGLMPYIARDVFRLDQTGLGFFVASFAAGALCGSVLISVFGPRVRAGWMMLGATLVWYLCLIGFVLSSTVPAAIATLLAAGVAQSLSMLSLAILLLRTSEARFRGRIMGVRMLAIYPLPLGLLIAGAAIPLTGYAAAALGMIVIGVALLGLLAFAWRGELLPRTAIANQR
jgi:predicted MFS family arabinose efflux permease